MQILLESFYETVKQWNLYNFTTNFYWNISKSNKLTLFQPRQPPFLSFSVYSAGGSEKSRFVGDEMMKRSWRCTELLQLMLEVTTSGSHSHDMGPAVKRLLMF